MNNSSQILRELQELKKTYRAQNLSYTSSQQARYNELTELRRAFVNKWYEDGVVWTGPSNVGKGSTTSEEV